MNKAPFCYSTHLWHDPFLTRAVVVLAHIADGFPMATHAEIVAVAIERHGPKPIYFRSLDGTWSQLLHANGAFVAAVEPGSAYTSAKLRTDFPVKT